MRCGLRNTILAALMALAGLAAAVPARAQIFNAPASRVRSGTADPASCTPDLGQVFFNTTTDTFKTCTALNTWTTLGGASTSASNTWTQTQIFTDVGATGGPAILVGTGTANVLFDFQIAKPGTTGVVSYNEVSAYDQASWDLIARASGGGTGYAMVDLIRGGADCSTGSACWSIGTYATDDFTFRDNKNTRNPLVITKANGQLQGLDGGSNLPTYSFASSTGTGLYVPSANQIGFAAGGAQVARLYSNGFWLASDSEPLSFGAAQDVWLRRFAANVLGTSNTTNAQALRIYNMTDSDTLPTNSEYVEMGFKQSANKFQINTLATGTGAARDIGINPGTAAYTWQSAKYLPGGNGVSGGYEMGGTSNVWKGVYLSRITTGGGVVTAASTGTGTGPTNTADTNSSDFGGSITVTAGTTPSSSGTLTVTFNATAAYGANAPACVAMLGNGTGTWNTRATVIGGTMSTTAAVFNWDNNAVNLTAAQTYKIYYHCSGR